MKENPRTTIGLKRYNVQTVYDDIYTHKETSIQDIALRTGLSMPTVSTNIRNLEKRGLVEKTGALASTGGRRAQTYGCQHQTRIAVGVELLKESIHIVAIDVFGMILKEQACNLLFRNNDRYYRYFGKTVNEFVESLPFSKEKLLGIGIAVQGLISRDGETIEYGAILGCTAVKRSTFQEYLSLPCMLIHDTRASAFAEVWRVPQTHDTLYFALNRNLGGTLIVDRGGNVNENNFPGDTIEHMCVDPDGPICYCGHKGCLETVCSADSLKATAGTNIPEFFDSLRKGDEHSQKIWERYLSFLAIAINNVRMVDDCDVVIGGYLSPYMIDDDFVLLENLVTACNFNHTGPSLSKSRLGEKAPCLGAAMMVMESFLSSI